MSFRSSERMASRPFFNRSASAMSSADSSATVSLAAVTPTRWSLCCDGDEPAAGGRVTNAGGVAGGRCGRPGVSARRERRSPRHTIEYVVYGELVGIVGQVHRISAPPRVLEVVADVIVVVR